MQGYSIFRVITHLSEVSFNFECSFNNLTNFIRIFKIHNDMKHIAFR